MEKEKKRERWEMEKEEKRGKEWKRETLNRKQDNRIFLYEMML